MSKIEVNQVSSQCGSTLTIGQSGDTVQLASGASQSGFGRTGTVDWDTTVKTAAFTAVSGNGYFINTTSAAITMTLPASPSAGDIVSFKDYAGTFATNNLTIGRNSSNLDGNAGDKAIDTNHTSMSLVYVDATQGWKSVEEGTGFIGEAFIVASGGTVTTCGDYKIHTFTGPGCFSVSSLASTPTNNAVDYLVVAGGGGTQGYASGGGGGGGLRFSDCTWTAPSPVAPRAGTGITVTATSFPITVGGGGGAGAQGSTSTFSTISSAGGGKSDGGTPAPTFVPVSSGGSGGGGKSGATAGNGNTPPVTPPQGNNGGNGYTAPNGNDQGGGGGGAGAAGTAGGSNNPGEGGDGLLVAINGSCTTYAGGGGAGGTNGPNAAGGAGGGGTGKSGPGARTPGTDNTGGGAGGGQDNSATGGSGIVILRYKFQ
jgi:hypothetical protein